MHDTGSSRYARGVRTVTEVTNTDAEPQSPPRLPVRLFATCIGDLVTPGAVRDAVMVLTACGCVVTAVRGATCCGQPAFNSGFDREARRVARRTLRAIGPGSDPVIVPAGSCAAMMRRHWPELFHHDRDEQLAGIVAARIVEFSEYVNAHAERLAPMRRVARVAYHDSCHMLRELRIRDQPREILRRIDGVELVDVGSADRCCGFGGTFSVRYPDLSVAMADTKINDLNAAAIDTLVSCDGGCLLQLAGRLDHTRSPIRAVHLATLMREAL
jgi:L-lactate dehydrogenase complex protein LldE